MHPSHLHFPLFILLSIWSFSHQLKAQTVCSQSSAELLTQQLSTMAEQSELAQMEIGEAASHMGQQMLGVPYVARTLELEGPERLVINLEGLDCTTFLENVVVMARLSQLQQFTREDYERELQLIRYRQGELHEYPSRLHYFSDWLYDNEKKGVITIITKAIGGEPYSKEINFMGQHRSAYAQLADDRYYDAILKAESSINQRTHFYIPKERVQAVEGNIQSGDLIAITTSINGLDISHVGIAIFQGGRLHLMHASTSANRVVISSKPLADYLAGNRSQSGIMVARLTPIQ